MSRSRAAMRPGARWRPTRPNRVKLRVAGRRRLRVAMPAVRLPHADLHWRRYAPRALVVLAVVAGGAWLYRSPLLTVHSVAVHGNSVLAADAVRQAAGLNGQSLINPDLDAARQRLLALPLVKDARVGRDWPFGATITIVERRPWGVWLAGDQRYVIDDEGVVLSLPAPGGAPAITQTDTAWPLKAGDRVDRGALAVATKLASTAQQTLGRNVTAFEFSQATGLTAVLDGGLRAAFGDAQDYDFKLATLFAVLQQAQQQGRELHSVDLRFGELVAAQ